MTWKEFKAEVERQGVKDEDEIAYIDVAYHETILARRSPGTPEEIEIVSS